MVENRRPCSVQGLARRVCSLHMKGKSGWLLVERNSGFFFFHSVTEDAKLYEELILSYMYLAGHLIIMFSFLFVCLFVCLFVS